MDNAPHATSSFGPSPTGVPHGATAHAVTSGQGSTDAPLIRDRRAESNAAIAARDADAVVTGMSPDITVAVAGGPLLIGRDAQRRAFAEQFADRAFRGYVRTPDVITLRDEDSLARETGRWVGSWQYPRYREEMRGEYTAEWRLMDGNWMLQSEIYTTSGVSTTTTR